MFRQRCSFLVTRTALLGACLLTAAGCGQSAPEPPAATATVKGTLQYQGKSLPKGTQINLYSMDLASVTSATLEQDGAFSISQQLSPGEYAVYLSGTGAARLPENLQSETSTPKRVTVQNGDNNLTINLE